MNRLAEMVQAQLLTAIANDEENCWSHDVQVRYCAHEYGEIFNGIEARHCSYNQ